ncbi:hypothetical protein GCM10023322_81390 [Rugosimonospora acidiphila]|uniref:Uncharacterized protein n=1 Tax=Rugosimonospora acidiphila TaxID=556531 RepID=A0ABP9SUK8_9ACTN
MRRKFTFPGPVQCHDHGELREERQMEDFIFVLLTVVVFAALALVLKAVERL